MAQSGGASFDSSGSGLPYTVPTGGLPGSPGAPIGTPGVAVTALQLLIEAQNGNTTALGALLAAVTGTVNGDIRGNLPGPITVDAINGVSAAPGTWTPTDGSGAGLVFTGVSGGFTRLGNMVFAYASMTYPANANGANAVIAGLPVMTANQPYAQGAAAVLVSGGASAMLLAAAPNTNTAKLINAASGAAMTNTDLSGLTISFTLVYPAH